MIYLGRFLLIKIKDVSATLNQHQDSKLKAYSDLNVPLKERVSKMVESLGKINPNPDLSSVLEAIVSEENTMKIAYKGICEEIEKEVCVCLAELNDFKIEMVKIDMELLKKEKELNKYCSIYAKVPPLHENKNDPNYSYFLENYERGVKLSQEVASLNFKIVDLLGVQKVLDNAYAGSIVELDYLIKRLSDLIKTFKYIKTPALVENYRSSNCNYEKLNKMVLEKNNDFDKELDRLRRLNSVRSSSAES